MAGNKSSGRLVKMTEQRIEIIQTAAKNGHSNKVIGQMLGFTETQWRRALDKHPEISDMMDLARANAKDYLLTKLQAIVDDPSHKHHPKVLFDLLHRLDKVDNLRDKIANIERMTMLKIDAQKQLLAPAQSKTTTYNAVPAIIEGNDWFEEQPQVIRDEEGNIVEGDDEQD